MYLVLIIYTLLPTFIFGYLVGRNAPSKTANIVFISLGLLAMLFLLGINNLGHLDSGRLDFSDVIESIVGGFIITVELMGAKFIASYFKNKSR